MIYLTAIVSLLGAASCIFDVGLILKKSRFYAEAFGWGLPSPLSFFLLALACVLLCKVIAAPDRRPTGISVRILLILGALMLLADQIIVITDALAPILWTALGASAAMLLLGIALLCGGISLLRGGMRAAPGGAYKLAYYSILGGGMFTLVFNAMIMLGMELSYNTTMYILPAAMLVLCVGIIALAVSMKKKIV